jgi:hypothetical protein
MKAPGFAPEFLASLQDLSTTPSGVLSKGKKGRGLFCYFYIKTVESDINESQLLNAGVGKLKPMETARRCVEFYLLLILHALCSHAHIPHMFSQVLVDSALHIPMKNRTIICNSVPKKAKMSDFNSIHLSVSRNLQNSKSGGRDQAIVVSTPPGLSSHIH